MTGVESSGGSPPDLARENAKLTKIVNVLMARVERSTDAQGNAFSLFQAAITLESTVRQRTAELQSLNRQLLVEIDERRTIERALVLAKREAERANQSKTEFLAAASHDLLQPLNVARLFLDALAERQLDAESAHMLQRVGHSLESANDLLRTLLEMSRLDAGALQADLRDVAIDPLLRRLGSEYGIAAEERGLRLRIVPCDAIVRTDPNLIERVLRNLLSNALRYTQRGGVIVGGRRRGGRLRLEVWDTGPGIAAAHLSEIFREFTRIATPLDGPGSPGMGLGLAIVERIAPLISATIDVRSRVGRGSVFALSVPLSGVEPALTQQPSTSSTAEAFAGRTVLIVDDDATKLDGVGSILRGWGLDTIAARSAGDAVAFSQSRRTVPAVILADCGSGDGTTGFEAVDAVRASFGSAEIPAIIITADSSEVARRRAVDCGYGYLIKPLRIERLRSLLAHMLAAA